MDLRWKRKGGRAVAEAAGHLFRVEDDGAYSFRRPSGAWEHDRAADAVAARGCCAQIAWAVQMEGAHAAADLSERRAAAAALAAIPPEHRAWAGHVAEVIVMVTHGGWGLEAVLERLPAGAARQVVEGICGDAAARAVIAARPRAQAVQHVRSVVLRVLGRERECGEA